MLQNGGWDLVEMHMCHPETNGGSPCLTAGPPVEYLLVRTHTDAEGFGSEPQLRPVGGATHEGEHKLAGH